MCRYIIAILLVCICNVALSQVWQWSVPVKAARNAGSRAFLWVPPDCKHVRAVVLAQNNMEEQSIVEHPVFREEMSKLSFAIIWVSPFFDHLFRFNEGAGDIFNGMMKDLANESGYSELTYVPVAGIGHSAAASWPYYFAAWNPNRTLCAISVSGQWPYFRHPSFAPDIWQKDQNIDFIPCLETMGEYEAANSWAAEGLKERQQHPLLPLSMLACPAEGHFAATVKKIKYIALYLKKAAYYRLPKEIAEDGAPMLLPIDPTKTGWLMDKWRLNQLPAAPPAPVKKYTGDVTQAFWFFDEDMMKATQEYQSAHFNKKAQLLGYIQNDKVVPQKNTHQQVDLVFQPMADGITFKVVPAFLDKVPAAHARTSEWTGLPAGAAIGHAKSGDLVVNRIAGPFRKINDTTFQLSFEKGLNNLATSYQCWFAAEHPGDKMYKPAVQQAKMDIPGKNLDGKPQTIHFPQLDNVKKGVKSIPLNAISSANIPVQYYVREGPAVIKGNILALTKIPVGSKYPVKVTIVAWQYGSNTEPKIKSAESVEQSFYITE
ncbi:hypothetical protein FAM09_14380 [Niastella caeni]|uniref:Uncharacterized protein n=2 Tax=Niastella caeni TaxID=2569763 RepID=A0A4S8HVW8_9BACT|nr:hypothetical protein FAM09_14380 [Niastella caeni]